MQQQLRACFALAILLVLPTRADEVRVRILEQHAPQMVRLEATGGPVALYAGDVPDPLFTLADGDAAMLSTRRDEVFLSVGEQQLYALALRAVAATGAMLTVEILDGANPPEARRYPGTLTADARSGAEHTLRLINHVDLETYVAAVLAREYGFDDLEGAKAVAVAVRTYARRAAGTFGPDYDVVDHVTSQVYAGVGGVPDVAFQAARATRGEVLTYDGALIEAAHFASSGGHTADNEAVWEGRPQPYLRGKADPYDAASPHGSWRSVVPRAALLDALEREVGSPVEGFVIGEESAEGRVTTVDVLLQGGHRMPMQANRFRLLLNREFGTSSLKSTFFTAHRSGDAYVFEGRGFGHGVGLAQWGAHEMSRRGHSYRDILGFYFTDVTLETATGERLALDASAPAPPPHAVPLADAPAEEPAFEDEPYAEGPTRMREHEAPPSRTTASTRPAREDTRVSRQPQARPAVVPSWTAPATTRPKKKSGRVGW